MANTSKAKLMTACVDALTSIETKVSDTFAAACGNITDSIAALYGPSNWELPDDFIEAMIKRITEKASWKDKPERQRAARQSEYRAIMRSYPFLKTAAKEFLRDYGTLEKQHLLKVARCCPDYESASDAAGAAYNFFIAKDKAKGTGHAATQEDKLIAGCKQVHANCKGSKMLEAFEKFLKDHKLLAKVKK